MHELQRTNISRPHSARPRDFQPPAPRLANAPLVSDCNHPIVNALRALQTREERERTQCYLLDGTRFVFQALQARIPLARVIIAPKMLAGTAGWAVARDLQRAGFPCLQVTPDVYRSLSLAESPQGLAAVAREQWQPLSRIKPTRGLCWIALEEVHSPGNLGTILRTSDAVGGAGLILLGDSVDPFEPATVRATMGALLFQQLVRTTHAEFAAWKRRTGCLLVGTSPSATRDYRRQPYPRPTVLWMGPEREGLSADQQAFCDVMVKIPMVGRSDSLNLAVATSVMLYELFNQQQRPGKRRR